jgi:AbrB family looped-hinge helix DNA binding protein
LKLGAAPVRPSKVIDVSSNLARRSALSNGDKATGTAGKNWRVTTGEDSLAHAKDFAEDWYLELRGKNRAKLLRVGKTFKEASEQFLREFRVIIEGERNPGYVEGLALSIKVHLLPFFGDKPVTEVTPGMIQEYRVRRATSRLDKKTGEPRRPSRSTLHQEIVALRHVLKTANRHGWLPVLPDLSTPFKSSTKVSHRGWFSPEEYKRLYGATHARVKNPPNPRWRERYDHARAGPRGLAIISSSVACFHFGIAKWDEPVYDPIMITRLTIDGAGRVSLPKPLRKALDLAPGDTLEMETAGEEITLRPIRSAAPLAQERGVWVFRTGQPLSATTADQVLKDIREQRDSQNMGNAG